MAEAVPEGIYSVGVDALVKRYGYTPDSMEQVMIVVDAVLPLVAAAEREQIRKAAQERLDLLGPDDFSVAAQTLADILLIVGEAQ